MIASARVCIFKCSNKHLKVWVRKISDSSGNGTRDRMRAWQIHSYGGLDVLCMTDSARVPAVKHPEDVLVEISASSVNPMDVAMMGGYGARSLNFVKKLQAGSRDMIEFPLTLGRDFSGKIVEKGHGVPESLKVGDTVWGVVSPFQQGCHAQFAIAPVSSVTLKPSNLSDIEAASILYTAVTAWSSLKLTGELCIQSAKGKNVLVIGGSGGLGSCAIQMLKAWGAQVVTTCNSDAVPFVETLGADCVIDYNDPNAEILIKEAGKYDIIFNAAGISNPVYGDTLKSKGCAKYITATSPLLRNVDRHGLALGMAKNVFDLISSNLSVSTTPFFLGGPTVRWGFFIPFSKAIEEIAELTSNCKLTPTIEKTFSFSELPAAYQKVLDGHSRGKTVIDMKSA
ncbi:reticulon-4-interacting protein 1 homolog, mitochondrial [Ischnura elegans]|uniref:reticulon-4-interacting protein 1 homolog, mitochondrial n=1 Tax=Ischnura elegans TaxID=197161 RepID=UPI001ED86687|nr:reticulon-4-interacting protein 1 homolog, mitochondrial [Ischnura elegans]